MDKFEILKEIDEWEKEIERLENSDEDESDEITHIRERISKLWDAVKDIEKAENKY